MISFRMKESLVLKNIMSGAVSLVDELKLTFTKEGLSCAQMCRHNSSAIFFSINKEMFQDYTVENDETVIFRTRDFANILRVIKPNETLSVMTDDGNAKLFISFIGERIKEFEIPLLRECENPDAPEKQMDFAFTMFLDKKELIEALAQTSVVDKEKKVFFQNKGNKLYVGKDSIGKKALIELADTPYETEYKASYNPEIIMDFMPCIDELSRVSFSYNNKYPCKIIGEVKGCYDAKILIAPFVENE